MLFIGSFFQPIGSAQALEASPVTGTEYLTPASQLLNPDGTLRLDRNFTGSLDLSGWHVQLDPALGPVFSTPQQGTDQQSSATVATGSWAALGSGGLFAGSLNGSVSSIAISGSDVYVGGWFEDVNNNGTPIPEADYIAKWNGSNWSPLGTNGAGNGSINAPVFAIAIHGSDVYVGGLFTNVTNNTGAIISEADYIARYDTTTGLWSALGNNGAGGGSLNASVTAIAVDKTGLFVGGSFVDLNNHGDVLDEADYIAHFNFSTSQWSGLGHNSSGSGSLNAPVLAITVAGNDVYIGGNFTDVDNNGTPMPSADYIARWSTPNGTWAALSDNGTGNGSLNGPVNAIAFQGNSLYVGGVFNNVANKTGTVVTAADYIAKYNLQTGIWSALGQDGLNNGSLNAPVDAIAVVGNIVYAGGQFFDISNYGSSLGDADFIAKWDGSDWSALSSDGASGGSLDNLVDSIVLDGDTLYAGGFFTQVNDTGVLIPQAAKIAAYGADNPPVVTSITRTKPYPTNAAIVDYMVTFSEAVYGVNFDDFGVYNVGAPGAMVYSYGGSADTYLIRVGTGVGNGTIQLMLNDNDTITDLDGNPLGGIGAGNGDFWGEVYTIEKTYVTTLKSSPKYDGWIREKSEKSNKGGKMNNKSKLLYVGDDASNRQYISILSFDTSSIPDGAVITKVTLKVKKAGLVGSNPFKSHKGLRVDIRKGIFGSRATLQSGDFQAKASKKLAGRFSAKLYSGWYKVNLASSAFSFVNKAGTTQFRLRFYVDDNNDFGADYLKLYSGNAPMSKRPQLIVEYYVP